MNDYKISQGKIIGENGVPNPPRFFADNRCVCEINELGIAEIDFFSPKTKGHTKIFGRSFWGEMRFYLKENEENHQQNLTHVELLPFGMNAIWKQKDLSFHYTQAIFDDSVCIELQSPSDLPAGFRFKLEFYDDLCFVPQKSGDPRYKSPVERRWDGWSFENNCLQNGFTEEESQVCICIGANISVNATWTERNTKYSLISEELQPNRKYRFMISIEHSKNHAFDKCQRLLQESDKWLNKQYDRYQKISDNLPVLKSPYPYLNDFFAIAPLYHEALKVWEIPGAIRAKTTYYWIWGWDGMTSNDAIAYWGDLEFIQQLLSFYRDYANEKYGIAHAFSRNMEPCDFCGEPAQGMYITLLYLYFSNGGNITPYYDFAVKIFNNICKTETGQLGLCRGTSLFPDFRHLLDETGEDISGFNNTVFYCAARSMSFLASALGDKCTEKSANEITQRIENHFLPLFFNREKQYICCSIDEKTFKQRNVYNANSIKWENNFCDDLIDSVSAECFRFFEKNVVTGAGLREIPAWCHAFDADANQLHCWWPVTGEFYARLINRYDKTDLIDKWIGWVSYWQEKLLCPEGISCYTDTAEPPLDNWNCLSGTWQAYSVRGFYQAAVHAVVGVDSDFGGITVFPYSGKELCLNGFHYENATIDFEMKGSGKYVEKIIVNGYEVIGTNKVPYDVLNQAYNKITVFRSNKPLKGFIASANAVKITEYIYDETKIIAKLFGYSQSYIKLNLTEKSKVLIDGKPVQLTRNPDGLFIVPVNFDSENHEKELRIIL